MKALYNNTDILKAIRNVAIYLRKSRGEEEEDLKKHRLVLTEICENNDWNYVEYPEIGSGDSIADRVKIQELLKDIGEGLYDAVIVMDYDRLGRGSGTDQDTIIRALKNSDTLVVTGSPFEILDANDERDEEMMEFKGFMARREYKLITKRLSNGRKIGLRMGRWSNGQAPYGYKYNAELKKLVPHEETKEVYQKLIVQEFLDGKSTYDIAWDLNKKKIPSPRDGLWTAATVNRLLKSEVHLGHVVFNKTEGVRASQTKSLNKKPFKAKPKEEWILVKNCHTPIKTNEEHMRILHIMGDKASHSKGGNVNALSGIVKCFNCKSTLTIQRNENGTFLKKCSNCGETMGGDIELVQDAIHATISQLRDKLASINSQYTNDKEKEIIMSTIEKLERDYEKQEEALERIEIAFEEGLYSAEKAKRRAKDRQEKIMLLEEDIKKEKKKLEKFSVVDNRERIKRIDTFLNEIKNTIDEKKLNMIYKSIINNVLWKRVDWYEVKVTVNFL